MSSTAKSIAAFNQLVTREEFQTGQLSDGQLIDVQRYFLDVIERQQSGEAFPFDLDELVPTVFLQKVKAVQALKRDFVENEDYRAAFPEEKCDGFGTGVNPIKYYLACQTFEFMVAKKCLPIFKVYRAVFHKMVEIVRIAKPDAQVVRAIKAAADMLRLAPSGRLEMLSKYFDKYEETKGLLPAYAIDAPSTATGDSSEPTMSATRLLEANGITMQTKEFNLVLAKQGLQKLMTRPSSKTAEDRYFWSVTEKGLVFGKNVTNGKNQRETQPHWYIKSFPALLIELGLSNNAAL